MKSAGIRLNIAVSCALALTVAFAPLGRANEVVRVNADGSVTRIQTTVPASISNSTPPASAAQTPSLNRTTTVAPNRVATTSNRAIVVGSSYYPGYPSYPGCYPSLPGSTAYTVPPGYTLPAPGYVTPAPNYGIPNGAAPFAQRGINSVGGTTTYGHYGTPPYPRAYPAYPGHYPAYPGYNCPPAAPVYTYPCAPSAYPTYPYSTYPYSTYPSTFNYNTTTSLGNFSYRNGGLSVTFGGSQVQSNIASSTRTLGSAVGGSVNSSTTITNSSRPFGNSPGRRW